MNVNSFRLVFPYRRKHYSETLFGLSLPGNELETKFDRRPKNESAVVLAARKAEAHGPFHRGPMVFVDKRGNRAVHFLIIAAGRNSARRNTGNHKGNRTNTPAPGKR